MLFNLLIGIVVFFGLKFETRLFVWAGMFGSFTFYVIKLICFSCTFK